MALVKAKGNMYEWVTHHWNPIKGGCQFGCPYCYVPHTKGAQFYEGPPRLDPGELRTHLGRGKIIFVGSMVDMWGNWIETGEIAQVLNRCYSFPENEYVFQSKNPKRFLEFGWRTIKRFNLGTTIETDEYPKGFKSEAPLVWERAGIMERLDDWFSRHLDGLKGRFTKFVTIEPIMDFNLDALSLMIHKIRPGFVTIGADSKGHGLIEPPWEKVEKLIHRLSQFTEIRQKSNLERLKK